MEIRVFDAKAKLGSHLAEYELYDEVNSLLYNLYTNGGNCFAQKKDEEFLKKHLSDFEFLGFIRQDEALIEADLDGVSPYDVDSMAKTNVEEMISKL